MPFIKTRAGAFEIDDTDQFVQDQKRRNEDRLPDVTQDGGPVLDDAIHEAAGDDDFRVDTGLSGPAERGTGFAGIAFKEQNRPAVGRNRFKNPLEQMTVKSLLAAD